MKIALDISPITDSQSGHKVRGVGKYIQLLQENLPKFDKNNTYNFFSNSRQIGNADIVHYPYFELFFRSLPLVKSKKTIVTVHDLTPIKFPKNFPAGLKGKVNWTIQKQLLKNVDAIVTDSESSKSDVVAFTGIDPKKITVAYLAADENFKSVVNKKTLEPIRKKYKLPDEFVLYVGDVTWNKNLPNLVQAIKQINVTLVLVGKALAETNFDRSNSWNKDRVIVQNLIKDDARFIALGFVSDEDLASIYNLADVFVMSSLYEGFGLPVLEAMKSGIPVVTTEMGSLPEVGGEAVQYVDPNNIEDIANGIGEVFFNPELQKKLSRKGLQQAEKFSIEKMIRDLVKVYESS